MTSAPANPETAQLGPSYDGTVMLDIGGEIGALILHTPPELHLAEIEISPVDGSDVHAAPGAHSHDGHAHTHNGHAHNGHAHTHDGQPVPHRTHVAVRERRGPSGIRYAAIYPGLREGDYTVWGIDGQPADAVHIVGGEVAQLDWR